MFVLHYKQLSDITNYQILSVEQVKKYQQNKVVPHEVLIFGGTFPLSPNQASSTAQIVARDNQIRGLSLNFTRMKAVGLKALLDSFNTEIKKAIRIHDRGLYSLDLTNNFLESDAISLLTNFFYDQFKTSGTVFQDNAPVPTSIRILTLDFNFLGQTGCNQLSYILETSRQLKVLSMQRCRIEPKDL